MAAIVPGRRTVFAGFTSAFLLAAAVVWHADAGSASDYRSEARSVVEEGDQRIYLTAAEARRAHEAGLLPDEARSIFAVDRLRHGDFHWNDAGVPPGELLVRVDLRRQILSVFRGGHEIGTAIILFGADGHETPLGTFPILAMMRDHRSSTYDGAPMPYTLRLTRDGVAVHGSNVRWGAATHGCIGLPVEFARLLFEAAAVGDEVQIIRSKARAEMHLAS